MKKIMSVVAVLGIVALVGGCSKLMPKKEMTSEEVSQALAAALCEKYSGCQPPPEFNKDQCLQQISTGLGERFKTKGELKVEQKALDGCLNAIKSGACEMLGSETAPTGCEFLN